MSLQKSANREQPDYIKFAKFYKLLTNHETKYYSSRVLKRYGKEILEIMGVNDVNMKIRDKKVAIDVVLMDTLGSTLHMSEIIQNDSKTSLTLLHCMAFQNNLEAVEFLLNNGADFTVQDHEGRTPLHFAIKSHWSHLSKYTNYGGISALCGVNLPHKLICVPLVNSLLLAQMNQQDISNPTSNDGLSHFHIACAVNNVEAVKFFLRAGISVDLKTNPDSTKFPEFTPLHFAVNYSSFETVKVLLDHSANIHLQDAEHLSSLHHLLQRYLYSINEIDLTRNDFSPICSIECMNIEAIFYRFFDDNRNKYTGDDPYIGDSIGLTSIHIFSALKNNYTTKNYLLMCDLCNCVNNPIKWNSPVWPGYTALHFAAYFNLKTMRLLLQNGANFLAEDAAGVTPLNICLRRYTFMDVFPFLPYNLQYAHFSNDSIKLSDMIYTMQSNEVFEIFIDSLEDKNLAICDSHTKNIWTGFTLLHIAILLGNSNPKFDEVIDICFKKGMSVSDEAANGQTPLQLAYQLGRNEIVTRLLYLSDYDVLFKESTNSNYPSHFHIACCTPDPYVETGIVKTFLKNKIIDEKCRKFIINDPVKRSFIFKNVLGCSYQINPGMTALHIAILTNNESLIEVFLELGGDPYIADIKGWTPLHLLFYSNDFHSRYTCQSYFSKFLLEENGKNFILNESFSLLHMACYFGDVKAVKKLLDQGADINAMINLKLSEKNLTYPDSYMYKSFFLKLFDGYTPLQIATKNNFSEINTVLIEYGVKPKVENNCGWYSIVSHSVLNNKVVESLIPAFKFNHQLEIPIDDTGLTLLHFACATLNKDLVMYCLEKHVDVNAKIAFDDTCAWSEFTPLHIISKIFVKSADSKYILNALLQHGADVTARNSEYSTPIHIFYEEHKELGEIINILLENQSKYHINPRDSNGLSHFHIACLLGNYKIMEKFIQKRVDLNERINAFKRSKVGYTALHMTLLKGHIKASHLLLKYGTISWSMYPQRRRKKKKMSRTDVTIEGSDGNTPLHIAVLAGVINEDIIEKIIRLGADVNAKNVLGESPLERFLNRIDKNYVSQNIEFFLKRGFKINMINHITQIGLLSIITTMTKRKENSAQMKILKSVIGTIEKNDQDENGFNIIHNIVSIDNTDIDDTRLGLFIKLLLETECKINHQDYQGRTPLHIAVEFNNTNAITALLTLGADINISDYNNRSPFYYCIANSNKCFKDITNSTTFCLLKDHLYKIIFTKLQINKNIEELYNKFASDFRKSEYCIQSYKEEIENMKLEKITEHLTVHDFLSEFKAVVAYSKLIQPEREKVDNYFQKSPKLFNKFWSFEGLLRLQHSKAQERITLWNPALNSMILLGIDLPNLCLDIILNYLTTDDLKVLVETTSEMK